MTRRDTIALTIYTTLLLGALLVGLSLPGKSEPARACWVEDKHDDTSERICGDVTSAPASAHDFSDHVPTEDHPAFNCRADGNQICGGNRP